jgi:hypothetical protein
MSKQKKKPLKPTTFSDQVAKIKKYDSKEIARIVLTLSIGDSTLSSYANAKAGA